MKRIKKAAQGKRKEKKIDTKDYPRSATSPSKGVGGTEEEEEIETDRRESVVDDFGEV